MHVGACMLFLFSDQMPYFSCNVSKHVPVLCMGGLVLECVSLGSSFTLILMLQHCNWGRLILCVYRCFACIIVDVSTEYSNRVT